MGQNLHHPVHFEKISFYVVAHADDWQLFMHPNVHADFIAPQCKVVFIITTAGDAGKGERYWLAREEGLKVQFGSVLLIYRNKVLRSSLIITPSMAGRQAK